ESPQLADLCDRRVVDDPAGSPTAQAPAPAVRPLPARLVRRLLGPAPRAGSSKVRLHRYKSPPRCPRPTAAQPIGLAPFLPGVAQGKIQPIQRHPADRRSTL